MPPTEAPCILPPSCHQLLFPHHHSATCPTLQASTGRVLPTQAGQAAAGLGAQPCQPQAAYCVPRLAPGREYPPPHEGSHLSLLGVLSSLGSTGLHSCSLEGTACKLRLSVAALWSPYTHPPAQPSSGSRACLPLPLRCRLPPCFCLLPTNWASPPLAASLPPSPLLLTPQLGRPSCLPQAHPLLLALPWGISACPSTSHTRTATCPTNPGAYPCLPGCLARTLLRAPTPGVSLCLSARLPHLHTATWPTLKASLCLPA